MIPNKWDNITIDQYIRVVESARRETDDPLTILNEKVKQVSIVTGLPEDEVEDLTLDQIKEIKTLLDSEMPHIKPRRFKFKGVTYRPIYDPKELTGGKYSAIMNLCQDPLNKLHQILFLLCVPQKRTLFGWKDYEFESNEMGDKIKEFRELPMGIANPISVFFCALSENLMKAIQDYSDQKLQTLVDQGKQVLEDLKTDMDG